MLDLCWSYFVLSDFHAHLLFVILDVFSWRPASSFRSRHIPPFRSIYVVWRRDWCLPSAPDSCYLVQKTFLPPNESISSITGWKSADPTSGEMRVFFDFKNQKSFKWGPEFQGRAFPGKSADEPKLPQPGLANRFVVYPNSRIPESKFPNPQISAPENPKFETLQF